MREAKKQELPDDVLQVLVRVVEAELQRAPDHPEYHMILQRYRDLTIRSDSCTDDKANTNGHKSSIP